MIASAVLETITKMKGNLYNYRIVRNKVLLYFNRQVSQYGSNCQEEIIRLQGGLRYVRHDSKLGRLCKRERTRF